MILHIAMNCLYLDGCSRLIVLSYRLPANIPYILICNNETIMIPRPNATSSFNFFNVNSCPPPFFLTIPFLVPFLPSFVLFCLLSRLCGFPPEFLMKLKLGYDFCLCLWLHCHSSIHNSVPAQGTGLTLLPHTLVLGSYSRPKQPPSPSIFSSHFPSVPLLPTAYSNNPSFVFMHCQTATF